jgi:hypothetical protein
MASGKIGDPTRDGSEPDAAGLPCGGFGEPVGSERIANPNVDK